MKKLIFDTDMSLGTPNSEIDDGAALMMLLHYFNDDEIAAITTTHGNTAVLDATHNTWRILSDFNRAQLPLGQGAAVGLIEKKLWFQEWQAEYGQTKFMDDLPSLPTAATLIIDNIRQHPDELTLIAVGPLTNLALAIRLAPDIVGKVKQIITMGGSFSQQSPEPEFNVHCDPEAAHIVYEAGWPIKLIGLNITNQLTFTRDAFAQLSNWNPSIKRLKEQANGWISRVEGMGWSTGGCALHDALAVAAFIDPTLFEWQRVEIAVELMSTESRGVTRLRPSTSATHPIEIATSVNKDKCCQLIWHSLQAPYNA